MVKVKVKVNARAWNVWETETSHSVRFNQRRTVV